jgi:hypothetical protein
MYAACHFSFPQTQIYVDELSLALVAAVCTMSTQQIAEHFKVTDTVSVVLLKSGPNVNSIHHAPALPYHHLPATLSRSHPC